MTFTIFICRSRCEVIKCPKYIKKENSEKGGHFIYSVYEKDTPAMTLHLFSMNSEITANGSHFFTTLTFRNISLPIHEHKLLPCAWLSRAHVQLATPDRPPLLADGATDTRGNALCWSTSFRWALYIVIQPRFEGYVLVPTSFPTAPHKFRELVGITENGWN